ncbi:Transposable element tcb1 transposase, partial [Caligus rogercresseyi]
MEQTRRTRSSSCCAQGTVLQPSSSCSSTPGGHTLYDITKKWEESGMSKRKKHKPRSDQFARPHLWLVSRGPSRPIRGRPCPSSPGSVGSTCRRPLDGLCGLRDPVHIPAGLGARPHGQTCAVLAEEECAQLLGLQHLAPNSPNLNPCDYY